MKRNSFFFLAMVTWAAVAVAQVEVKLPYKPSSPEPTPITYGTGPAPVAARTSPVSADQDAAARRAAALAKVQGKSSLNPAAKEAPTAKSPNATTPVMYSSSTVVAPLVLEPDPEPATTVTVNGLPVQRTVRPGRGQIGRELFTPVSELHFVQFAVYCKDTPVDKAPALEGLYLLWHPGSICPGGAKGASYIVKGYTSQEEARAAVAAFKAKGIDCWYNPALTGAEVEIIGVR